MKLNLKVTGKVIQVIVLLKIRCQELDVNYSATLIEVMSSLRSNYTLYRGTMSLTETEDTD